MIMEVGILILLAQVDEETKVNALRRAYELNEPRAVKTIPVEPPVVVVDPSEHNVLDQKADVNVPMVIRRETDTCTRVHRHKVFYDNGRRWRCRK